MEIKYIIEKGIIGLGCKLINVNYEPDTGSIKIVLEKSGNINITDIEMISDHIKNLLKAENIDYNDLEISTPGSGGDFEKLKDLMTKKFDYNFVEGPSYKLEQFDKFQNPVTYPVDKIKSTKLSRVTLFFILLSGVLALSLIGTFIYLWSSH